MRMNRNQKDNKSLMKIKRKIEGQPQIEPIQSTEKDLVRNLLNRSIFG